MSYMTQARLADDGDLLRRVAACVAAEGIVQPEQWAYPKRWQLSAQPGWVQAYADAIADGEEQPGAAEAAITDPMILAAVRLLQVSEISSPA